jgi:carboxypeptidase D
LALFLALSLNQETHLPKVGSQAGQRSGNAETSSALQQRGNDSLGTAVKKSILPRVQGHFTLLSNTSGEWRFRFNLGSYQIEEIERADGRYSCIRSEGAWFLEQSGKPELPVFRTDFAVPANAEYHLEIVSSDQERIACLPPLPSSGAVPRKMPALPPALPEAGIYQGSTPFPAKLTTLTAPYQLRKVTGVGLQVTPMQYFPQEGNLLVTRSFEAILRVSSETRPDLELDENASFAFLQQENFLNGLQMTRSENSTVGTLLLLLPDDWQDAAADFILWKRRTGYQVFSARYPSDIGEGSENIANYIANYYANHALTHVILCGGWNVLPPWRLSPLAGGVAPSASHNAQITTDAPYALLTGQTPDSPDYAADVLLSRIPVSSKTELISILNKLRQHERGYPDSAWRDKGLFLASSEASGNFHWDNDFIAGDNGIVQRDRVYIERLRQLLLGQGDYSSGDTLYAGLTPTPTSQLVSSSLNSGVSLFYYLGHGNYDSFLTSGFNVNAARGLVNDTALSFVVSPVCHTGNFAITAGDCLSEALLKHPTGGAAAVLASTGYTYWRAPIVLLWKFTDALLADRPSLPDAGTAALNSIIEGIRYCQATSDDESGAQKYFLELMHLFGDCAQVPRLGAAKGLQVTHQWTADGLLVKVFRPEESGALPVSGAKVCLSFGSLEEEEYLSGCSDDSGEILLPVGCNHPLYILRVIEGGSPLQEIQVLGSPNLDSDEDGVVSHQELLSWLSAWDAAPENPDAVLASALAQWQAGGSPATRHGGTPIGQNIPVYPPAEFLLRIACADHQELKRLSDTGANITGFQNEIAFVECTRELADLLAEQDFLILEVSSTGIRTRALSEYPHYEQICAKLLDTAARYPLFCRPSFVGKSVQGREILALRLSLAPDGAEVPELLIAGGIHGDEPPGTEMIMRLLQHLCEQAETEAVQHILQNCVLWLMPLMNPDGLAAGTRGNANNADLNRNFPDGAILGGDILGTLAAGSSLRLGGLQPEQVAIMRWLSAQRITAALHLHTGALKVCYPYGNYLNNLSEAISPDDEAFRELSSLYAGLNGDMSESHVINAAAWYPVVGELADWQYRFLGTLPLTVELVGPDTNKAPAYSTMETLWDANRPALLGWIEEIRSRYPQGLPHIRSGEGVWQAEYIFDRPQYVPGYENLTRIRFKDFSDSTPTALILVTKTPENWAISAALGGLQPLANRIEGNQQTAWVFYPRAEGWGAGEAFFTLTPPECTVAEAIFSTDLYWDGGSGSSAGVHWLPLPERDFALSWTSGWNAISFPLKIKASQRLPFDQLWKWEQLFAPASEIRPGQGYFGYAETSGGALFSGWMTEESPPSLQNGWNLHGVIWKSFAGPEEQILLQPTRSAPMRPPEPGRELLPGNTFWHFF